MTAAMGADRGSGAKRLTRASGSGVGRGPSPAQGLSRARDLRPAVRRCTVIAAALLLTSAAASAQESAAPVPSRPAQGLVVDYPVFRPVVPPPGYRAAIEQGTRSDDGRPGPGYWQQRVDYRIETELHPTDARLEGRETITYTNSSPDSLPRLVLHLYQNVFSEGVTRNRPVGFKGGVELKRVAVAGVDLEEITGQEFQRRIRAGLRREGGYLVVGTIAHVLLPTDLPSGGSMELEVEWAIPIPDTGAFRMGHLRNEIFNLAQWYPQVAVYDDVYGQDASPYLGNGEFYTEFGSFDVSVTVPVGWVVVGTGVLKNAEEVLRPEARRRLEMAAKSDEVIGVVTAGDRAEGRATAAGTNGKLTWRFHADSVRDFAFAAGVRYVWDATSARTGDGNRRALIHVVRDPAVEHWKKGAEYAKHALEFYSDFVMPYPYPHATVAYGPPQVGGMEYPMVTFINRSAPGEPFYSVVAHELGHFWFPMIVQNKEMAFPWMDEGITNFDESLARADFFDNENARRGDMSAYIQATRFGVEAPLMEHTDFVEHGFGRAVAAYMKPATILHSLRHMLGAEKFDAAFRQFATDWAFKHPLPWDFFNAMERAAGEDLDWFWQAWFYETVTLDQAIEEVTPTDGGVSVTVKNLGDGVMPVELELELEDGTKTRVTWEAEVWAATRTATRTLAVSAPVKRIVIDPDSYYPDTDRSNNSWTK